MATNPNLKRDRETSSRSLERVDPATEALLQQKMRAKYPLCIPKGLSWAAVDGKLKLVSPESDSPPLFFPCQRWVAFLSTTGSSLVLKWQIETHQAYQKPMAERGPDDAGNPPPDPLWDILQQMFGVSDGSDNPMSLHDAVYREWSSMVPSKAKPPGWNAKNCHEKIKTDLNMPQGAKPIAMCAPLKHFVNKEDEAMVKLTNMKQYLTVSEGEKREPGTVPTVVVKAFANVGIHDSAIHQHFKTNPDAYAAPDEKLGMTVADGRVGGWDILAAAWNQGGTHEFAKVSAQAHLGGMHVKYLGARQMFLWNVYFNGRGLEIVSLPGRKGSAADAEVDNGCVYDTVFGARPAAIKEEAETNNDVYGDLADESPAKRAK